MAPNASSTGTNKIRIAEPGATDREAILYELADPTNLGVIEKLEQMYGGPASEVSTESSESFETIDAEKAAEERREILIKRLRKTLKEVPDSVLHILSGNIYAGDCGRPADQKPDWLDMEKLRRGQKFVRDNMFSILFAEMLGVFGLYNFQGFLRPILMTKKSSSPYTAFRRYSSTILRMRRIFAGDPWAEGTTAWKDMLSIRAMHAAVTRKFESLTNEEADAVTTIPDPWSPLRETLIKDFSENCQTPVSGPCPYAADRNSLVQSKIMNQAEMAITQWNQTGLLVSFPERFGVHNASDEDLEAFCHLWRSIGYQLGIEERFNYCRGTLEEIRQRNRDFVETWVKPNLREITPEWEHVMRCIFAGATVILPGVTFETALLHMTEIFDLQMPRFCASLSYTDWVMHHLTKSFLQYGVKLPGVSALVNIVLNRALDRTEKLTSEDYKAIRIKLSNYR